ncbi:MAG: T9SS type A sorting domain-containing protein, partial [Bacteroidota bacterium]
EVYFMGDGTGYVMAAGRQHNFSYPTFEWFDIQQEFDLDNDVSSVIINGVRIASWMFSTKPNHDRSFSRRLAAMNYYPADNKNQFYIDNVRFNKVDSFDDEGEVEDRNDEILPPPLMEEELSTLPSFNMSYYPNPASSDLTVEFNIEEASDIRIELINSIGQTVLRYEEDGVQVVRHQFDISNQATGLYYIKAWAGNQQITRPVVITK